MAPGDNYGTVSNESHHADGNGLLNGIDEERAALLGKPTGAGDSLYRRLHKHMTVEVSKSWGDIMLLSCYIITGLLDSSSVQVWGSFVSMQTGNTIYIGVGLAAPTESSRWIRAAISVGCFCLGSFFFSRYHRYFGGRKRWVIVLSYLLQLLMITAAAIMVTYGPVTGPSSPVDVWVGVPIALIAFQSAGQAVISRMLKFNTLTSVVLTSIYLDLFSDQQLFAAQNVERNQKVAAPILLCIGALIGGFWAHSEWGLAGALWTAVVLKAIVIAVWCFWKADPQSETAL